MKCPVCNTDLRMTERQGVEIDYCPQCRGVWLDRGELDKIIERSARPAEQEQQYGREPHQQQYDRREHEREYKHGQHGYDPRHKKRKEGFLGQLFDFD